jgi:uncharacterized protein YyaL (SSP411 family)
MTGQGGWPMTCFLTPEGEPFYCGTYYPPRPRQGMPSFRQVLDAVIEAWRDRREKIREAGSQISEQLREHSGPLAPAEVDSEAVAAAVAALEAQFDENHPGFGGAPKFPPSMVLEFLLRHHERTGSHGALAMTARTAEAMARGGMYDQLGGGFARYSTDREWIVPHFEKMLYDNAQLLGVYAHLARRTGSPLARRVAEETAAFLLTDLATPEGGFASSLDADADGEEGLTYFWTPAQLRGVLGADDGDWAAEVFGVTERGTFERGGSVLRLPADPDDHARWESVKARLLASRRDRPQPARDDKVVAAWNGLAIGALARAGAVLDRPEWVAAAERCAELLLALHRVDGRLRRTSRAGTVGPALAVLDDYGCLAEGLLALHQATGAPGRLAEATGLLDDAAVLFRAGEGVYHDTGHDAEQLVSRPADSTDNVTPAGASALASALLEASALAGRARTGEYRDAAERALSRAGKIVRQAPRFAGKWLGLAEAMLAGPVQVAVTGPDEPSRAPLLDAARTAAPGGGVVLAGPPEAVGVPLLTDRPLVDGAPAAYVCRGYVCDRPVTTAPEVTAALRG